MNPPLSIEQLKRLKGIMQTMLAEANNANWQELSRLDSERRVLIGYKERTRSTLDTQLNKGSEGAQSSPRSSLANTGRGTRQEPQATPLFESPASTAVSSIKPAVISEHAALSAELTALDKEINTTVLSARNVMLEQTRVLRAQVSAKKGYEKANTIQISSYS